MCGIPTVCLTTILPRLMIDPNFKKNSRIASDYCSNHCELERVGFEQKNQKEDILNNFMGDDSLNNFMGDDSWNNFMGDDILNNFMGDDILNNFMGDDI